MLFLSGNNQLTDALSINLTPPLPKKKDCNHLKNAKEHPIWIYKNFIKYIKNVCSQFMHYNSLKGNGLMM